MKSIIRKLLANYGYTIARVTPPKPTLTFTGLWLAIDDPSRDVIAPYLAASKSQYAQDLFVVAQTSGKKSGFFVEFGATDGVRWSNTWLLERRLGWTGILAEPARVWHPDLSRNRSCKIDRRCVTDKTGEHVDFLETGNPTSEFLVSSPELSSLAQYAKSGDWASKIREGNSKVYSVETVSLNDLLAQHRAPREIDYVSLDTEGSELLILRGLDFERHTIQILTIEHNYNSSMRSAIRDLLSGKGYSRIHEEISGADDWYVLNPTR
jgi:FkbM family methyltransferase